MLRDDIARYTELSGNDGEHTPIGIIGAFLDGYETGLKDRPKGEWIEREDYNGDPFYDCSVCGESFATMEGTPEDNMFNFCPNCGADMRGEE